MTTRNLQARLLFDGGWATDFGPTAPVVLGRDGHIRLPFLVDAENAMFFLDGGAAKINGVEAIHTTALKDPSAIRGLVDYWVLGVGSTATQHRVLHVKNDVMKDDGDGAFTSILSSADRDTTSVPSYAVFDDDLIIMSDADEAPLRWTGSGTATTLGTNTPNFSFGVTHKNRFFAAGAWANKSRVFYSEPLPQGANGNWDEVEAGFIDVDPDDGDEIRGLVSHKGELWVFKGPYTGSIHRISGDTPLGSVTAFGSSTQPRAFELNNFIRGVGAASHNAIFKFRDDIGFIDGKTGSVRSLNATAAYGDFREASLSFPINDFLLKRANKARLKRAWAVTSVASGCVLITMPIDGSQTNNMVLCMDFRFDPPRWSQWPAVVAECAASVIDSTRGNRESIFIGGTNGFVQRTSSPNRNIQKDVNGSTAAINYKVTTPFIDYGSPIAMKTFARGSVGIQPKGSYEGTFSWTRDNYAQQSISFDQGGGDVLAADVTTGSITAVGDTTDPWIFFTVAGGHGIVTGDRIAVKGTTDYNGVYDVIGVILNNIVVVGTFTSSQTGTWQKSSTANYFVLGSSTLSGSHFVDRFFSLEEGGQFRSIQYQVTQTGLNEDIELHSIFTDIEVDADSTENS